MAKAKSYWIKERHNPQFDKPYFVPCGQLSKREAMRGENTLYGFNIMHEYQSLDDYNKEIDRLKSEGYNVH